VVKNVDLVLNTANAETNARSIGIVREGGTLVSVVGAADAAACAAAKIRCTRPDRSTGGSSADMLAQVGELADAGKFKVYVDGVFRWPTRPGPGRRVATATHVASSSSRCRPARR
jgi:NADPH:quinone reductase-like Zn-dependent oxidoreductase